MSEDFRLDAYLERIGFSGSIAPTLATLEALHALQPAAIPFENLDSLRGLRVPLDQPSLDRKLIAARRGGYCFELNLLFLRLLGELGFAARGHLAGVLWGGRPVEELAPDHMLLTVDIGGAAYLADVGFGGLLLTSPLQLLPNIVQPTALGDYRLTGADPALRLEFRRRGEDWRPVYQFSLEPVGDAVLVETNDALGDDPDWFFHHHLVVDRASATGRRLLFDTRLTTLLPDGDRQVETLPGVATLRDTLGTVFGIGLADLEGLDAALARLVAAETD